MLQEKWQTRRKNIKSNKSDKKNLKNGTNIGDKKRRVITQILGIEKNKSSKNKS